MLRANAKAAWQKTAKDIHTLIARNLVLSRQFKTRNLCIESMVYQFRQLIATIHGASRISGRLKKGIACSLLDPLVHDYSLRNFGHKF